MVAQGLAQPRLRRQYGAITENPQHHRALQGGLRRFDGMCAVDEVTEFQLPSHAPRRPSTFVLAIMMWEPVL
jgi:hypothetical protein